ncbi:hypothetical protein C7C46_16320 [Streptomyces tateyamensis]|uniref:Uncharacterized protein n=1 Tax=Streptomyces tateyamensis TaxID=565073 RepID=A0A2V4NR05_9ACTN|nr:hypothetical protein [Streptomyces tateyamensis]PYC78400.1 hypothetical protein C7C46_16320 [Streptomyces tateyamensis]
MDPISATAIAAAAIAAKSTLEAAAQEAGKASWGGAARVVERIRARFGGDRQAQQVLERAQRNPQDESATALLRALLQSLMQGDPVFADELRTLVDDAVAAQGPAGSAVNAAVIKNVQVNQGPVEVHGDLNFN